MSASSTSKLVVPDARFHSSWLRANAEWGDAVQHGWSRHLSRDLDLEKYGDFSRWVDRLIDEKHHPLPEMVTATNRWIVDGEEFLGAIQLRHELSTDYLLRRGGHIGYGIRPSARGRGLAKLALRGMLDEGCSLGIDRVLVTCLESNAASAATIRRCGGRLDSEVREPDILRFWINPCDAAESAPNPALPV